MRIAEEVSQTKQPCILKRDNQTLAVVMPVGTTASPKKNRAKTKIDSKAFRAAFGSWNDVDFEQFKVDIYADRRRTNTHPPVKL